MAWRTKAAWREEPWWHWDWPNRPSQSLGYYGTAQTESKEPEAGTLKAAIMLPDPNSESGWQLHQVYDDPPETPERRKLGL